MDFNIIPNIKAISNAIDQKIHKVNINMEEENYELIDGIIKFSNKDTREIISTALLKRSDLIYLDEDYYYITSQPNHRYNSYYRAEIKKCDVSFRVKYAKGEIVNYHAITDKSYNTMRIEQNIIKTDDSKIRLILKDTDQSWQDVRFYIKNLVYEVETVSYATKDFVILNCKRGLNGANDDIESGIAYNDSVEYIETDSGNDGNVEEKEDITITISGYHTIWQGQIEEYIVEIIGTDSREFIVEIFNEDESVSNAIEIFDITENSFKAKMLQAYKTVDIVVSLKENLDVKGSFKVKTRGDW